MALSSYQHELLSGYLDNRLEVAELREVEQLLDDPEAQEYLQSLKSNRLALKQLSQQLQPRLPADFASRVLASASAAKSQQLNPVVLASPMGKKTSRRFSLVAAVAGLAALLIFAVSISNWFGGNSVQQDVASNNLPSGDPLQDKDNTLKTADNEIKSSEPIDPPSPANLVRRQDLQIHYLLTLDVEVAPGVSFASSIGSLLSDYGIGIAKSAKVNDDIEKALDEIRVSAVPNSIGSASEVYLLRAPSQALSDMIDEVSADLAKYPQIRFGLAFEAPNDPLLNKLSADNPPDSRILLGQAMADSLGSEVDVNQPFAAPLVDKNQSSRIAAIPSQGEVLVNSNRKRGSELSAQALEVGASSKDRHSFLLLFIRRN